MKKRLLFITIVLAVSLFSVAAVDNLKIGGVIVCFSADKNGINFDNVLVSATGTINDTMSISPKFIYSPDNVEDSGFSLTVQMTKPKDPDPSDIGGIFALLSKFEQYKNTEIALCFRNPEKKFLAVEFDVTSSFSHNLNTEKTSTLNDSLGFLISLTGDSSRTGFHYETKYALKDKFGLTASGKLHYLDKTVKFEDLVAGAEFYVTKEFTPSISFEYSYDKTPQENGIYAVLNLSELRLQGEIDGKKEDKIEINAYAKAGVHFVNNSVTFDVKKASISAEFRSNIDIVNRSGSKLCFKTAFEYINDYKNTVKDNGFFAKFFVSGRYFGQYANRAGFALKLEKLEKIKDLNFKILSENYINTFISTDFPK